jgi:hypothetical protein
MKTLIIKYLYTIDFLARLMLSAIVRNEALAASSGKNYQDA